MAKRNSDGDVLSNQLAVGLPSDQNLLASMLGGGLDDGRQDVALKPENSMTAEEDDRFGVGFAIPKDFEDGSLANKVPTSDDKLLKQLLGEKAAKAHLDARKSKANVAKLASQNPRKPQPTPRKVESEDEEEGRASAIKSKKQKTENKKPAKYSNQASLSEKDVSQDAVTKDTAVSDSSAQMNEDSEDENIGKKTSKARQQPSKPTGYLDQVLSERSKKKKKSKS